MRKILIIVIVGVFFLGATGTMAPAQDKPEDKKPAEKPATTEEKKADDKTEPVEDKKPDKADAKDDKAKPEAAPEKGVDEGVTLASVQGAVDVRPSADAKWIPAKVGMKLGPNWEISTGLRGKAILVFKNNSVVVVQRLTEMEIRDFSKKDVGKIKTRIKMKYGALQIQVKKGTALNDFQVASPTATASVRGTKIQEMSWYRGIGGKLKMGNEGTVLYKVNPTIVLGPNQQTDDKLTAPIVFSKKTSWVPVNFAGFTKMETESSFAHGTVGPGAWDRLRTDVGPGASDTRRTNVDPDSNGDDTWASRYLQHYVDE